jgi:hypothetical protein
MTDYHPNGQSAREMGVLGQNLKQNKSFKNLDKDMPKRFFFIFRPFATSQSYNVTGEGDI